MTETGAHISQVSICTSKGVLPGGRCVDCAAAVQGKQQRCVECKRKHRTQCKKQERAKGQSLNATSHDKSGSRATFTELPSETCTADVKPLHDNGITVIVCTILYQLLPQGQISTLSRSTIEPRYLMHELAESQNVACRPNATSRRAGCSPENPMGFSDQCY